jgi:hypothetical protein
MIPFYDKIQHMANLRDHEEDSLRERGEPFTHVHEWLDELFKYAGPDHRSYRHNRKGIEEVRRGWGGGNIEWL